MLLRLTQYPVKKICEGCWLCLMGASAVADMLIPTVHHHGRGQMPATSSFTCASGSDSDSR